MCRRFRTLPLEQGPFKNIGVGHPNVLNAGRSVMTEMDDASGKGSDGKPVAKSREDRLSEALRANLQRRKGQQRARNQSQAQAQSRLPARGKPGGK